MSAGTLLSRERAQGLRPVELRADLPGITDLIELCFGDTMDDAGRAAIREMRMVSNSPSLMLIFTGADQLMGGLQQGFVWVDQAQIIGNVSVSPAGVTHDGRPLFMITNVAVHPDHRRRGIAYSLMEAALQLISERGGGAAVLQVHLTNETAHRLYLRLGFRDERCFTKWRRPSYLAAPLPLNPMPPITLRPGRDWRAEYTAASHARPNSRGGMGWLHRTTESVFQPSLRRVVGNWVSGQAEEHWILPRSGGIMGALRLTLPLASADRFDLLVDPAFAGQAEEALLNFMLRRLVGRHRAVVTEHPTDDTFAIQILERYEFERGFSEINMRYDFP
jgi:ribosomal protein S18 acetylase RimI-like enzyme